MRKIITILLLLSYFKGFSQQPIFATIAGGDLYSFDLTNCSRHFIGSTGKGFGDIAFTPDGHLWGIVSGNLYHIDTSTANVTLIGNTGIQAVSLVGLDDSTLLAEYRMKLYRINITTANSFYIDSIGYQASGDLTWYDNDLYMVTSAGQIIRITMNAINTAIQNITAIGFSIPTCEGAISASFSGNYNSLIGFNGPNLLKICQIDGSYQTLCPNLNIGGTPGAASIRLPTQSPEPNSCTVLGIEQNPNSMPFSIYPNPTIDKITIRTNNENNCSYSIFNSLGQLVKTGDLENNETSIYIPNLENGIYGIELMTNCKTELLHFIVEK